MVRSVIVRLAMWLCVGLLAVAAPAAEQPPKVLITTSLGKITVELYPDKAPITVKNFLAYVDDHFYDGTIFHRVVPGFVIQGGGFDKDMHKKPTRPPIKNEAGNGLKNEAGTIAMARTSVVDSATSQFYINLKDNPFLDHRDNTARGFGYAVFGRVVDGMGVVRKIAAVPRTRNGIYANVPVEPVVIKSIRVVTR